MRARGPESFRLWARLAVRASLGAEPRQALVSVLTPIGRRGNVRHENSGGARAGASHVTSSSSSSSTTSTSEYGEEAQADPFGFGASYDKGPPISSHATGIEDTEDDDADGEDEETAAMAGHLLAEEAVSALMEIPLSLRPCCVWAAVVATHMHDVVVPADALHGGASEDPAPTARRLLDAIRACQASVSPALESSTSGFDGAESVIPGHSRPNDTHGAVAAGAMAGATAF